jgi:hypothetical protein
LVLALALGAAESGVGGVGRHGQRRRGAAVVTAAAAADFGAGKAADYGEGDDESGSVDASHTAGAYTRPLFTST